MTRVHGKVLRSTRGHPGSVRLEVERAEGGRLSVLVAPDKLVESLGLSLRPGENVDVTGSLLAGPHPMLVATEFNVDGRQVRVRDEQGRLVKLPVPAAGAEQKPHLTPRPAEREPKQRTR
jgi:hypothetical protein